MLLSFRFSLSILFLLHVFSAHANSHWTVNSLPGFSGELPFSLETGYVGVGDWEEFQLFYYFIKSYSNPKTDPLVLWLTGGPGCSALSGLAFESGPINFEGELKEGSLPRVLINPYSWTQGYILGNPITIPHANENCQIPFAHNMALISDELYQSLEASCQGEYVNIDPNNVECLKHYDTFTKCTSVVRDSCILWSKCSSLKEPQTKSGQRRSLINSIFVGQRCREHDAILAYYWANNDEVQKALHIHEGSIGEWIRCRGKEYYNFEMTSVFPYHVNLSSKGYRSLIYSGDHDMVVPHMETHAWIKALNYSIVDDWRPWFIEDEVGGYTRSFANNMTFVTVKGGGHTPEYLREESSIVFKRWIVGEWL
ncbi:serine carboxypeptidase-like 1 isoform X3 [Cucumis sativus]|uniref:serine carboxypeptidase-like 1 isoform X3 n=1 Tax=Cucumis sativus TaxID=3659 RepID=UPI0012F50641|nr:serine carboxypeptidase-like 1 isoform X3 [Cucumis sativus]